MRLLAVLLVLAYTAFAAVLPTAYNIEVGNNTVNARERDGAVAFQFQIEGGYRTGDGKHWWFLTMKELRKYPLYSQARCYNMKSTDISSLEFYPDDDNLQCQVWNGKNCKGEHTSVFLYKEDAPCYHTLADCRTWDAVFYWGKHIASMKCWQKDY